MENKRMFTAIVICAGIFLFWQQFYVKPYAEKQEQWKQAQAEHAQAQPAQEPQSALQAPSRGVQPAKPSFSKISEEKAVTLGSGDFQAHIAMHGGVITDTVSKQGNRVQSSDINVRIGGAQELEILSPSQEWMYLSNVPYKVEFLGKDVMGRDKLTLHYEDAKISVTRDYVMNTQAHTVDNESVFQFKSPPPNYLFMNISAQKTISKEYGQNERREVLYGDESGMKHWKIDDVNEVKEVASPGRWAGVSSRYFLKAVVDDGSAVKPQFQARPYDGAMAAVSLVYRVTAPTMRLPVRYYYGVKEVSALKKVGNRLDLAVDFGWFTVIAYPMLEALKGIHAVVKNFGIAIILLTIFIKILLYPLTYKSVKGMREMQRIQPQIKRLQEKYKNDKQALNQETLKLMQANGYNPMSGCLPMVVQMPIFIALYNVLYGAFDLYRQPFFGWITDLSMRDPFFVTPIIMMLLMFMQQKITPTATATDPTQQKMMQFMPLMFGGMMAFLPAGLTLYMLVNSAVSIVQQLMITRGLNTKQPVPAQT